MRDDRTHGNGRYAAHDKRWSGALSEVWKYPLDLADQQDVEMPEGAELLYVGKQNGNLALWARVIPTGQKTVRRSIVIRGTGQPIWSQPYIGTVLQGSFVWHVFDGGETT